MSKIHPPSSRSHSRRPADVPANVSDAEASHALYQLKTYPAGLSRVDLERAFGSDRRGRHVMAALAERGIAAIVVVPSPYHADAKVYRLATSLDEVEAEQRRLLAYETSARRRREGVARAWARGPATPQGELF